MSKVYYEKSEVAEFVRDVKRFFDKRKKMVYDDGYTISMLFSIEDSKTIYTLSSSFSSYEQTTTYSLEQLTSNYNFGHKQMVYTQLKGYKNTQFVDNPEFQKFVLEKFSSIKIPKSGNSNKRKM